MSTAHPTTVYAAGAVLWRIIGDDVHVLVIHRTEHKDISLPKGKVDPGETLPQTAVREIREETGIKVALGVPLGATEYVMPNGKNKFVQYWAAEVTTNSAAHGMPNWRNSDSVSATSKLNALHCRSISW